MFLSPVLIALLNRNRRMVDENLSVGGRNHVGLKGNTDHVGKVFGQMLFKDHEEMVTLRDYDTILVTQALCMSQF